MASRCRGTPRKSPGPSCSRIVPPVRRRRRKQSPRGAADPRRSVDFRGDQDAFAAAMARDNLAGYEDFLAAYPDSPLAVRVRAIVAVRREAITWRRTLNINTREAYWSYLRRYPEGAHVADAQRRLARLAAAFDPPPAFVPLAYDVPPPPPDEVVYLSQPVVVFDGPGFYAAAAYSGPVPAAAAALLRGAGAAAAADRPVLLAGACRCLSPRSELAWESASASGSLPRAPAFVVPPPPPPVQQININNTTIINNRRPTTTRSRPDADRAAHCRPRW